VGWRFHLRTRKMISGAIIRLTGPLGWHWSLSLSDSTDTNRPRATAQFENSTRPTVGKTDHVLFRWLLTCRWWVIHFLYIFVQQKMIGICGTWLSVVVCPESDSNGSFWCCGRRGRAANFSLRGEGGAILGFKKKPKKDPTKTFNVRHSWETILHTSVSYCLSHLGLFI